MASRSRWFNLGRSLTPSRQDHMMEILEIGNSSAGLAELVDALDSGSSVRKDFRVRVSGSALISCKKQESHF
jgi:hypothetical protein